jgi:CRISPR-associated protein Csy2
MTSTRYLLLDRLNVQGANGWSSPLTYGFPALTGFVGFGHALSRRLRKHLDMEIDGVLVASHGCRIHRFRPHKFADYTFVQSRNPILRSGKTAAIIEHIKTDVTVSLVLRLRVEDSRTLDECEPPFTELVWQNALGMRLCGGSIFSVADIEVSNSLESISRRLLPSFILNDGSDRMAEILQVLRCRNSNATGLDALLELNTRYQIPRTRTKAQAEENAQLDSSEEDVLGSAYKDETSGADFLVNHDSVEEPVEWSTEGVFRWGGWYVPIPVGYQSISPTQPAGSVKNARGARYENQFVESIYGLGKWEFPTRISDIEKCFWRYDFEQQKQGFFLLTQN